MGLFSRKNKSSSRNGSVASESIASSFRKGSTTSLASSLRSPISNKMSGSSPVLYEIEPSPYNLPPPPDPAIDPAGYLRSIYAVRERNKFVIQAALQDKLTNFTVDLSKLKDVTSYVTKIIKRDYAPDYSSIPPHGRWQHFEVGGRPRLNEMMEQWGPDVDAQERVRRLLDLFLVSVLLDAGSGNSWKYTSKVNQRVYRRSEGLAIASLEMFREGLFSSNPHQLDQVDGVALKALTVEKLAAGLQVSPTNPIDGLEGRASLLIKLGDALDNQEFFGVDQRPGNLIDYLLNHPQTDRSGPQPIITVPTLWDALMTGLAPIWPATRTQVDGIPLGDAWPCSSMPPAPGWERIVPFHKLTQWLAYSLLVPPQRLLNVIWAGTELLTGLPEYRNGGLLIDTGLLTLKAPQMERGLKAFHEYTAAGGGDGVEVVPMFSPSDDVVVEWRATTLGFLDILREEVNAALGLEGEERLSLAQVLEAGTWKGGRELAEVSRPNTRGPPIMILSDGTVF